MNLELMKWQRYPQNQTYLSTMKNDPKQFYNKILCFATGMKTMIKPRHFVFWFKHLLHYDS